jgi:hypothetical protein
MQRVGKSKEIIVAFSFGKGAYEESTKVRQQGLDITLKTVEETVFIVII